MAKTAKQLKASELSLFASQISLFMHSGLSLSEGLTLMEEDIGDQGFRRVIAEVRQAVDDRKPLSEAMESTGCFPPYMIRMASIGEVSGHTEGMMEALTRYYERETALRQRVKSSVTYPLLLVFMMGVVVFLMVVRVLPMFSRLMESMGRVELPGFIVGLLGFGDFVTEYWWVILAVITALAALFLIFRRTPTGRRLLDSFKANSIFTRGVYRKMCAERFITAMGYLIASNVDIEISLELTRDIMNNHYMSGKISQCGEQIRRGVTLYDALHEAGIFPRQFSRMLAIGFKSGEIDSMMARLTELYEQEVDSALRRATSSIEPIFVSVLSVVVGVILISVMLPLIEIMSMIG